MMKTVTRILILAVVATLASACYDENNYSYLLDKEKKQINAYIEHEGIKVVHEEPADDAWGKDIYYAPTSSAYNDGFHFHLVRRGDSIEIGYDSADPEKPDTIVKKPVKYGNTVCVRYKKFTLTPPCDTIESCWSTLDSASPIEFMYSPLGNSGYNFSDAGKGFYAAIELMKYPGSECIVIVPSKMGTASDIKYVTPYGYRIKFETIKNQ